MGALGVSTVVGSTGVAKAAFDDGGLPVSEREWRERYRLWYDNKPGVRKFVDAYVEAAHPMDRSIALDYFLYGDAFRIEKGDLVGWLNPCPVEVVPTGKGYNTYTSRGGVENVTLHVMNQKYPDDVRGHSVLEPWRETLYDPDYDMTMFEGSVFEAMVKKAGETARKRFFSLVLKDAGVGFPFRSYHVPGIL